MSMNFPASPTIGQLYPDPAVADIPQYRWDGEVWAAVSTPEALTYVRRTGDTMTGSLVLPGGPVAALEAATKQYVDDAIVSALASVSLELMFTRSLSQHMTRLYTSTSSAAWTFSAWVKRVGLGTNQAIFGIENAGGKLKIGFAAANNLVVWSGDTIIANLTPAHTNTNLWYNLVFSCGGGAPSGPRAHTIHLNNNDAWDGSGIFAGPGINNAETHYIGQPSYYPDLIMKDVNFIDGSQLVPTDFGYDAGGVWTPKPYSGAFGFNGFRLNFNNRQTPASTTLGRDSSGNNNHWTAVNF